MDLAPGTPIRDIRPDTIFIGSCTNSRMEDLRVAAGVVAGRTVADGLRALVVPGLVRGEAGGGSRGPGRGVRGGGVRVARCRVLDVPGHEPRHPEPGRTQRLAPANRNFEGRQGKGGRTHLVSPAVAAATAIAGHFTTPEEL